MRPPPARGSGRQLHAQWLLAGGEESVGKDTDMNPSYDESLRELWSRDRRVRQQSVFDGEGDVTPLTAPYTLANAA